MMDPAASRAVVPSLRLTRVAVLFAALLAAVFLGVGYTAVDHERDHMESVLAETAGADGRWIGLLVGLTVDNALDRQAGAASAQIGSVARGEIDAAVAELARRSSIVRVRLLDVDGRVLHAAGAVSGSERSIDSGDVARVRRGDPILRFDTPDEPGRRRLGGGRRTMTVLAAHTPRAGAPSPVAAVEVSFDVTGASEVAEREFASYRTWVIGALGSFYLALVLAITWGAATIQRLGRAREAAVAAIDEGQRLLVDGLESMTDAVIMYDRDARVQVWNAAYLRFLPHLDGVLRHGLSLRAILEANVRSGMYGLPPDAWAGWVDETYRHLTTRTDDITRELADGRTWVVMTRETAHGGRIQTIRDVTAELRAQRDLAAAKRLAEASESDLRDAVESFTDGFALLDRDQRVVLWNSRYPVLLPPVGAVLRRGATLRDLVATLPGSSLYTIPPEQHQAWIEAALPRLWDGPPFIRRLTDGRYLRIAGTPTRTGGRILALRDVTDDVKAKEKTERLALVAERTDNAVAVLDAEGRVEWINAGFERLTGYGLEDVLARDPIELAAGPDTDAATLVRMREALAQGAGYDVEILSYARDRRPYWVQLACTPVRSERGDVARFVVIGLEITARKEQERLLGEALARERDLVAQQRRFVAVIAHEFRTPLTIIDGAAQRMSRYAAGIAPDDLRERASRIRAAVQRMAELVDTTLNSARLDEGRFEVDLAPVDLVEIVAGVARRLAGVAPEFAIVIEATPQRIVIDADPRLLEQIFANLISNAIKYSGTSRRIEIMVAGGTESAQVRVRDHGIGVPAAELDRLFTRFFRASTARGLPGTGIGLNLVKELVTLHGGDVEVESRVGDGTTFTVTLPVRASPAPAASAAL